MKRKGRHDNVVSWFKEYHLKKQEVSFYAEAGIELSKVSEAEREFFWNWCGTRHLDDIFAVVALTYWVRARAEVAVNFLFNDKNKILYMVLCIHLSLKWLGYDEEKHCNFLKDLVDAVGVRLKPEVHQRMEMDLLKALNWEM